VVHRSISVVFLLLFCAGCNAPVSKATAQLVSAGDTVTVTDVRFPSKSIGGMFRYRAIVPKGGASERFPVLYLLHGAGGGPDETTERTEVVRLAGAQRLIVVMPAAERSYYTNAKHRRNARWEDAMASELPLDVEARFPVMTGREHTGIAGISMGGYGAVKLALKHPEQYGFAGSMSGALDITRRAPSLRRAFQTWNIWSIFGVRSSTRQDEDVFVLLDRMPNGQNIKWFESCGQNDPLHAVNARFVRLLRARGASVDGITTPGGHGWQSWNAAMPQLFTAAATNLR